MEQKTKIERNPVGLNLSILFPELVRQQVGTTCGRNYFGPCAVGLIDYDLYNQVWMEAHKVLHSYLEIQEDEVFRTRYC